MQFWRVVGLASVIVLCLLGFVEAAAERRVALVIGNSQYESVARLPNSRRDAELVAASLQQSGFTSITLVTDLTREKLVDALRRFAAEAERSDWAVVYYAGHGIEMNGMNYLIPVDARLKADRDLQFEAVPMSQVLSAVDGARKLRLLVLDACRDNPFAASMTRSTGATRSIGRGLAWIEPQAGTLVVYAAKHGQVAEDGEGANSPFVISLVKQIATPGLEINRLFRRVTGDVLLATNRRQEPFTYGSLPDEDFYFRDIVLPSEQSVKVEPTQTARPEPSDVAAPLKKVTTAPPVTPVLPPAILEPEIKAPGPITVPAIRPAPRPSSGKKMANVDPTAAPSVVARPATPRVKERSIPRAKAVHRPEPSLRHPKRGVQAAEIPEPYIVRSVARVRAARPAATGGKCFSFNGQRVCE